MKPTVDSLAVVDQTSLQRLDSIDLASDGALFLIDKPASWTSFDVVARLRTILGIRRIGHCGTLDPMATGLLQVCVGPATRLVDTFQAGEKEYIGTMRFGGTTPSDDAETEIDASFPVDHLHEDVLRAAANSFVGEIEQIPPMYSARKIRGKRLYEIARSGRVVERPPRRVTIRSFDVNAVDLPDVDFRVVCSRGTYIRSLVRDLGTQVDSGAHLIALRRTRSGNFGVDHALSIDAVAGHFGLPGTVRGALT